MPVVEPATRALFGLAHHGKHADVVDVGQGLLEEINPKRPDQLVARAMEQVAHRGFRSNMPSPPSGR